MRYYSLCCDTCGYITEEPIGVYQCPVCGAQMRFARKPSEYVGNQKTGPLIMLSLFSFAVIFVPVIGIFLYPIVVFLIWYWLRKRYRDNAIRLYSTDVLAKSWVSYTCNTCGNTFEGQRGNCPYCGAVLTYFD